MVVAPEESPAVSVAPVEELASELRESVLAPLARLRRRACVYLALAGAQQLAVAVAAASLVQFFLDWSLKLPLSQRIILSGVLLLYWAVVVWRKLIVPLSRPMPDHLLAGLVDRANPDCTIGCRARSSWRNKCRPAAAPNW
jgi:hypothetical protein